MSMGLTEMQYKCLDIIETYIADTGRPPSFDEMTEGLGLKSKSGVHRIVAGLEERGRIRRLPNRARAIEVLHSQVSNDRGDSVKLNPEIRRLLTQYAAEERIGLDTAANALLRDALGAV